jgi:hypothetical protein
MYSPISLLSKNSKTGTSINLPTKKHCTPTKNCAFCCYGRIGHTRLPDATKKAAYVSRYLSGPNIDQLVYECQQLTSVRLSGVGDLLMEHIPNIISLAKQCPQTIFWGMTRKLPIAYALQDVTPNIKLMVSVDATSPKETWAYTGSPLCYGPRLAQDIVPNDDPRILTIFPYHFAGSIVNIKLMPKDSRDCPAVRHEVSGCQACGRCWKW